MADTLKELSGGCLCGAVRFVARDVSASVGVCHCEMCRRWTGSALLEVTVPEGQVSWQGEAHIAKRQTSSFAERAWCRDCGSGLYFRMTEENEFSGTYNLPLGLFDAPGGFEMTHEIWIDEKPDSFAYEGAHPKLTRADCLAKFPKLAEAGL